MAIKERNKNMAKQNRGRNKSSRIERYEGRSGVARGHNGTYRVQLTNGVIESVTTNKGAMYAGALACSQYRGRNPEMAGVKVAAFLPIEGGTDGHSIREIHS